jgi:hypothetical protein
MKIALITLLALTPTAVLAEQTEYRPGGMSEETCFKYEYREEYVPGTSETPGYVKSYSDKIEVPCRRRNTTTFMPPQEQSVGPVDDNSCVEGSIIGGLLGGGAGAAASREDGRFWAIPLGIVGGAMVGCQIDGG